MDPALEWCLVFLSSCTTSECTFLPNYSSRDIWLLKPLEFKGKKYSPLLAGTNLECLSLLGMLFLCNGWMTKLIGCFYGHYIITVWWNYEFRFNLTQVAKYWGFWKHLNLMKFAKLPTAPPPPKKALVYRLNPIWNVTPWEKSKMSTVIELYCTSSYPIPDIPRFWSGRVDKGKKENVSFNGRLNQQFREETHSCCTLKICCKLYVV